MQTRTPFRTRWFGPLPIGVAWIALIAVFVHPPHGTGVPICWLDATTGVPCPGCGMTRSMSSAVRGMMIESWTYHPFGAPILLLFAATASFSLLPNSSKRRVVATVFHHRRRAKVIYIVFIAAFLTFGVGRAAEHFVNLTVAEDPRLPHEVVHRPPPTPLAESDRQ